MKKVLFSIVCILMLSLNSFSQDYEKSGISFAIHVGANYHITDTFSAFTELGTGPVIWKLGARMSFLQ